MQTKSIIIAAINADATITQAHKNRILAAIENNAKKKDKLLTTKQACALLGGIHPITMRRLEMRGLLQPIRYSKRKLRWRESEILNFLETGIVEGGYANEK